MPKNPAQAIEFGVHLTELHERAGGPSFGVMHRTILINTGGHVSVSDQQLTNYHRGNTDPANIPFQVLVAIKRFYGCESADLGPVAAAEIAAWTDLVSSDQPFVRTGWLTPSAGQYADVA